MPRLDRVDVLVFAGNHGVTRQGVSPYPATVTAQMVGNFARGGAAINQLARAADASLTVIPLDLEIPTQDFTEVAAMSAMEFLSAVSTGYDAVREGCDLLCLGEMGIGNTTAAAAIASGLFGGGGSRWAGRGTGIDDAGLRRKCAAIDSGLALHAASLGDPIARRDGVGGARTRGDSRRHSRGAISRQVLLDGFVCTAVPRRHWRAWRQGPSTIPCWRTSRRKAGHRFLAEALGLRPSTGFRHAAWRGIRGRISSCRCCERRWRATRVWRHSPRQLSKIGRNWCCSPIC